MPAGLTQLLQRKKKKKSFLSVTFFFFLVKRTFPQKHFFKILLKTCVEENKNVIQKEQLKRTGAKQTPLFPTGTACISHSSRDQDWLGFQGRCLTTLILSSHASQTPSTHRNALPHNFLRKLTSQVEQLSWDGLALHCSIQITFLSTTLVAKFKQPTSYR